VPCGLPGAFFECMCVCAWQIPSRRAAGLPFLNCKASEWHAVQSVPSRADTPLMSEREGAFCTEVPHLPAQPLKLLHSLSEAMKTLTLSIRQMLYSHGSYSAEADTRQQSALNMEAAEYQQVRAMPALRGLSEAYSIAALGSEVCCSMHACMTGSMDVDRIN
jgi:hypothetical protein